MVIVRFSLGMHFASRGRVFAFSLILSILLSGCGGDDSSDPAFVSAARPQVVQLMSDMQAPGAVVYVQSPKGNWLESFGVAERGTSATIPTNANFRVGSVTKTWTATVILQLVQEAS